MTTFNNYSSISWNSYLADALQHHSETEVLRHFFGSPIPGAPALLNEAAVVCLDAEWWQKNFTYATEIGIAELMSKGLIPSAHAENILTGIQVAHARIIPYSHLRNNFPGAGNPELFHFGTSKFISLEEARKILIDTFMRPRQARSSNRSDLQPIILIGHAIENALDHIENAFGLDLRRVGTVIKIIDTQDMARAAGIQGPKGPNISLTDLLAHFNIHIDNLHTAGNDASATLITAVLLALKDSLYPGGTAGKPPTTVRGRNIQDVVQRVMDMGKTSRMPAWGRELFCTRCGRDNHVRADCMARVECAVCRGSGSVRLFNAARTHGTDMCLYRYFNLPMRDYFGGVR